MAKKDTVNNQLLKAIRGVVRVEMEGMKKEMKGLRQEVQEVKVEMREGFHRQDGLLEDVYEKIKILAEGQGSLHERLERLEKIIPAIERIETDVDIVKTEIKLIRQELARKTDHPDFLSLERRVVALEQKVGV